VSKEDFQLWFKTKSRFPLAIKGHSFALSRDGLVKVDGGKFVYEEAVQLVTMLNSRSPFTQMNATLVIWEERRPQVHRGRALGHSRGRGARVSAPVSPRRLPRKLY